MKKWLLLFALIFLGSVGGAAVTLWLMPRTSVAWTGESAPIRLTGFPEHIMEHPNFVAASAMAAPAVVNIKTKQSGMAGGIEEEMMDPFRDFFGRGFQIPRGPQQGSGSGVILSADGYIVTNHHVVKGADEIEVVLNDKRSFNAKVVGSDQNTDIALLKIEAGGLNVLSFGNSDALQVGEWVLAVGNPFNLNSTVTAGIVSAKGRNINILGGGASIEAFIQTDAAVNPGNSGGPVMQSDKVVGVAFQGFRGDVAQNVGYMIPTPVIRRFLKDVEDGKYDHYVDIAVRWMPLENPAMRKYLNRPNDGRGVVVTDVFSEGSSDGHLEKGDVLLSIDGHAIESDGSVRLEGKPVQLEEIVERKFAGEEVRLEVWREGKTEKIQVPLKPADMFSMYEILYEPPPRYVLYGGCVFQPLTANLMAVMAGGADLRLKQKYTMFATDQMYRETPEPVILSAVLPDSSNVYLRGLAGQIVREINGKKIRALTDVEPALAANGERTVIRFEGDARPAVLKREEVEGSTPRIMAQYGIREASRTEVGERRLAKGSFGKEEAK